MRDVDVIIVSWRCLPVLRDCLRLARTDGIGPVAYRRLMARYSGPAEAIAAIPQGS